MVVYHTTKAEKPFEIFRIPLERGEIGVHFGTAAQAAQIGGPITFKVYLSLQNPLRTLDLFEWTGFRIALELDRQGLIPAKERKVVDRIVALDEAAQTGDEEEGDYHELMQKAATLAHALLIRLGYDGIIYRNRYESEDPEDLEFEYGDAGKDADLFAGGAGDSYLVLHPSQIKSVDNRGTFDPANPSMLAGLLRGGLR